MLENTYLTLCHCIESMKTLIVLGFILGLLIGFSLTKGQSLLVRIGIATIGGIIGAVLFPIIIPIIMIAIAVIVMIIIVILALAFALLLIGALI